MLYVMFGLISPVVLEKEMNMWKEYDNENDDDTDRKRTTTFDKNNLTWAGHQHKWRFIDKSIIIYLSKE